MWLCWMSGCQTGVSLLTSLRLYLSSSCLCVLGQIFGHFDYGVRMSLGVDVDGYASFEDWVSSGDYRVVVEYGFTIDQSVFVQWSALGDYLDYNEQEKWELLQEAWIAELTGLVSSVLPLA